MPGCYLCLPNIPNLALQTPVIQCLWLWYSERFINFMSLTLYSVCKLLRRDTDPSQVQFNGSRPGKERTLPCPGHLLSRCGRQRHPAQLLWGRCHHPASAWSPRRLALWGEWEEQDVSNVLIYSILPEWIQWDWINICPTFRYRECRVYV